MTGARGPRENAGVPGGGEEAPWGRVRASWADPLASVPGTDRGRGGCKRGDRPEATATVPGGGEETVAGDCRSRRSGRFRGLREGKPAERVQKAARGVWGEAGGGHGSKRRLGRWKGRAGSRSDGSRGRGRGRQVAGFEPAGFNMLAGTSNHIRGNRAALSFQDRGSQAASPTLNRATSALAECLHFRLD